MTDSRFHRCVAITKLINDFPGITSSEISEKLGLSSTTILTSIQPRINDGRILIKKVFNHRGYKTNSYTLNPNWTPSKVTFLAEPRTYPLSREEFRIAHRREFGARPLSQVERRSYKEKMQSG
jgi:hypothetical protein